ncbi:ankyrin repeat-containing domain protein [Massariosphaeria phaeospora]|uniref:Ankyrin repeat-containing domain protein n=1 Tax=Massariosphaeria phaeospora TaxID=100035 RepID=A0A7C8MCZ7_9PLEO|nr:ankyrin repeat-containing domain protein [Massariosphaeria phaeospora]
MVDRDIISYVEHTLQSSSISDEDRKSIRDTVPSNANGLFLYAKLAMDAFLEPGAFTRIPEILQKLPADLHDMYTTLLQKHARRSGVPDDIQLLILQWATHATRPLRLLELAEMLNSTCQSHIERDLKAMKDLVRAAAGPLLEILPDETISVIHHSFTEYLKCVTRLEGDGGYPILRFGPTHGRLALACLVYLRSSHPTPASVDKSCDDDSDSDYEPSNPWISPKSPKTRREERQLRLKYPFFAYAAANWHVHVTRSTAGGYPQTEINGAINQFLGSALHRKSWLKIHWTEIRRRRKGITLLHIAARYGLTEYARVLVDKADASLHVGDAKGWTPLWWAAAYGHGDIIRLLAQTGVDPDAVEGDTGLKPLHEAVRENHLDAIRALLEAGVDPLTKRTREDARRRCGTSAREAGRTPLMHVCHRGHLEALDVFIPFLTDIYTVHRALVWSAEEGRTKLLDGLWRQLLELGVDPNQGNYQGRTALHVLAASQPGENTGCWDLVLAETRNVDQEDNHGLTALHFAVTVSIDYVLRLLAAGFLLEILTSRQKEAIDAPDERGHTPLYYACRYGMPETVRLLLDARADATHHHLFDAVATFEDEEKMWHLPRPTAYTDSNGFASGLTIDDQFRLAMQSDDIQTQRLEEIVDMLVDSGCDASRVDEIIQAGWVSGGVEGEDAAHAYTLTCLMRARERWSAAVNAYLDRRIAFGESAAEESRPKSPLDYGVLNNYTGSVLERQEGQSYTTEGLLQQRQYDTVERLHTASADLSVEEDEEDEYDYGDEADHMLVTLRILVANGFDVLLDKIGTHEMSRELEDGKCHAFDKEKIVPHEDESQVYHTSLLFTAVHRTHPNMQVVRLLVEKFHVDVNGRQPDAVLHFVAQGHQWWHVALALPYLVSHGADVNVRDEYGETPLHVAIRPDRAGHLFQKDAARALIACGADVNAVDEDGTSCLARAIHDMALVQLLVDNGAVPKADVMFQAINAKKMDLVQALLASGVDSNMRRERCSTVEPCTEHLYEEYMLYVAAARYKTDRRDSHDPKELQRVYTRLVETLLAHGADPYAPFKRKNDHYTGGKHVEHVDIEHGALLVGKSSAESEFEDSTVLHALIQEGGLVYPMLQMPGFDPNRRDANGLTILHVACYNSYSLDAPIHALFTIEHREELDECEATTTAPSFLDHAFARGADPLARDNAGRNILHHLLHASSDYAHRPDDCRRSIVTLTRLANAYPALINQADIHGRTPLHAALRHAVLHCDTAPADALLTAGADPFAVDAAGHSALHILAYRVLGSAPVRALAQTLMRCGVDINARNARGEPPLFNLVKTLPAPAHVWVPRSPRAENVRLAAALALFEAAGAQLGARDGRGRGVLHVVAAGRARRRVQWFKVLVGKGCDPKDEDAEKRWALDVAAACRNKAILAIFEKDGGEQDDMEIGTDDGDEGGGGEDSSGLWHSEGSEEPDRDSD